MAMYRPNAITGSELGDFIDAQRISSEEHLYAIVDAARDKDFAFECGQLLEVELTSVFPNLIESMREASPYLFPVEKGNANYDAFLEKWARAMGNHHGILLLSTASFGHLRIQIRKMFFVEDEDRNRLYFRFYDPRVLRAYLPTCNAGDAEEFFGAFRLILVEAEKIGSINACAPSEHGVSVETHDLKTKGKGPR